MGPVRHVLGEGGRTITKSAMTAGPSAGVYRMRKHRPRAVAMDTDRMGTAAGWPTPSPWRRRAAPGGVAASAVRSESRPVMLNLSLSGNDPSLT
jgi:hypothetical protein